MYICRWWVSLVLCGQWWLDGVIWCRVCCPIPCSNTVVREHYAIRISICVAETFFRVWPEAVLILIAVPH